jgi:hypothetical protein
MEKNQLQKEVKSIKGTDFSVIEKVKFETEAALIGCFINWRTFKVVEIRE